jgi:hypothetical protein
MSAMSALLRPKKKWLLALARKQPLSHCPENPPNYEAASQDDAAVFTCPA